MDTLQSQRLAGNTRVVSQQESRPPPEIRIDERFANAFPVQAQAFAEFNIETARWWANWQARQTKE